MSAAPRRTRSLSDFLASRGAKAAAWLVVAGVLLRALRYLLCFPMWGDEQMYLENLLDRSIWDAASPLGHNQVAPAGFTFVESLVIESLGFSEWSARLFPLACSIAALLGFAGLAWRVLPHDARVYAIAAFAVAPYPIRLACDAKPYSCDLLAAIALLFVAAPMLRDPKRATSWRWLALAGASALAAWFSFPSVFVVAALATALSLVVVRHGDAPARRGWAAFVVVAAISFGLSMRLSASAQYERHAEFMREYWAPNFPPSIFRPVAMMVWLLDTHTSAVFAFPVGAAHGGSILSAAAFAVGAWAWFRGAGRNWALVAVAAFGATLAAAALRKYPYGAPRLSQHLAPLICLGFGLGFRVATRAVRARWRATRSRWWRLHVPPDRFAWYCGGIALVAAGAMTIRPYRERYDHQHREFAKRFWNSLADERVECAIVDHRARMFPVLNGRGDPDTAPYRCYQERFRTTKTPPAGDEVVYVLYRAGASVVDQDAYDRWSGDVAARFEIVERRRFVVAADDPVPDDVYETWRLRPRKEFATTAQAPAAPALR